MNVNEMCLEFDAVSQNESFARVAVSAFFSQLNPTLEEIADVKTAVSEAVTNVIVHAYPKKKGKVKIICRLRDDSITIHVSDDGVGIEDIKRAREPFYTTMPGDERSGMGFTVMEAFMDDINVNSAPNKGTEVILKKKVKRMQSGEVSNAG